MGKVPRNRDEAFEKFKEICSGDNVGSRSMLGIYDCYIGKGADHYKAYEEALKAYLSAAGVNLK